MSVLAAAFSRRAKKAALLAFITAGFPRAGSTPKMLHSMVAGGADILELGVPFSDPMADGPAIQRSSEIALKNGMSPAKVLEIAAEFRAADSTPLVLMGYANSFLNFRGGIDGFAAAAERAGVNGLIVVDLADDERAKWRAPLAAAGVEMINLVAPTTPAPRMRRLAAESRGFLYAVSLKGVTGAAHIDAAAARDYLAAVRECARTPVAAGFGVRTAAHARALAEFADGIVVGSRLAEAAESAGDSDSAAAETVRATVAELSGALAES
ncbi:MAG: tryptophan synthase subunit alpha [Gammaproteobacteria bacterium]